MAMPVRMNALAITSGNGDADNPFNIFVDMKFNSTFTLDLTQYPATADTSHNTYLLLDTYPGAPAKNAHKLVTIIVTGMGSLTRQQTFLNFTKNFGIQYNQVLDQIDTPNDSSGVAVCLISNGKSFIYLYSGVYD